MSATTKFPTTYEELAEMGSGQHSFSATWEEYLDLLKTAGFRAEYDENRIITMSTASDNHEGLVLRLGQLFLNIFDEMPNYHVRGSNRPVQIGEKKVYNPDLHITKETPMFVEYSKGLTANLNPWLIVEVLSPSTQSRDWNEKLPNYKKKSSVQYILYIKQEVPFVSFFKRIDNSDVWENLDYDRMEQEFVIAGQNISMKRLYHKILK